MNLPAVEKELSGKVAFVMGGSSSLGLASARLLAERGAAVTIFGHAPDTLTIAADLASTGLKIHGAHGDGAQSKIVNAAIEETVFRFGGLDILVGVNPGQRPTTRLDYPRTGGVTGNCQSSMV